MCALFFAFHAFYLRNAGGRQSSAMALAKNLPTSSEAPGLSNSRSETCNIGLSHC